MTFPPQAVEADSLRAADIPLVSAPGTWDEVDACAAHEALLRFGPAEVLERAERLGDLFALR